MDSDNNCTRINLSTDGNKIKYYESGTDSCIFEILEEKEDDETNIHNNNEAVEEIKDNIQEDSYSVLNNDLIYEQATYTKEEINSNENKTVQEINYGEIKVKAIIDYMEKENLQGAKINLYKINGLSPILIDSQLTDEQGIVTFEKVEEGSYRVIELIDKRYFEKPKYLKWNEITIDSYNKEYKILIINKIKKSTGRNRHKL